jgi:predicted ATPase/DNA-binding CsgD family transcriptional regulator/transcriptional regulator with XRE-family HTH domain
MSGTKSGNRQGNSLPQENQSFGLWLKQRRVALDMTQQVLALQADCSTRTIRQLEADRRRPSRQLAERLALALGISPNGRQAFLGFARGRLQSVPSTLDGSVASLAIEHPLPVPTSQLIGRDETSRALTDLLLCNDVRLLTLVGPPGVGKTRLAIHVAANVASAFRAGACFVELAAIHNSTQVIPTIATALGLREQGTQSLAETLIASLRDSQVLLVLDNFEQISAAAPAVAHLLAEAPDLKVLVTSRTVLHVRGEHTFRVMPLSLPELRDEVSFESLTESPAVTLFVQRARAMNPDLALDLQQMRVVAEICIRLDGLPLAIELAAARLNTLSPLALLQRLDQRLDLLRWSMVDSDSRHQTLRGAILWSYELLNSHEQALFRRLGVFAGGCTLEAGEAVCGEQSVLSSDGDHANQISQSSSVNFLDEIGVLVDHNLVHQKVADNGEIQFTMLESLRTFALEQLEKFDETTQMRHRHAEYYLRWIERLVPWLQYLDQQAIHKLSAEYQNCLAALTWSLTNQSDDTSALQLALSLYPYWHVCGYLSEGRQWLQAAITHNADQTSVLLARAQAFIAELARLQDDYVQAEISAKASLSLGQSLEDTASIALALVPLGWIEYKQNHLVEARQQFEVSLQLFRELGKTSQVTRVLHDLAYLAMVQGHDSDALTYYEEELALASDNAHQQGVFWALHGMSWIAVSKCDWRRAKMLYNKCLTLAQDLHHADGVALAVSGLAFVARAEGKYGQAACYLKECERMWRRLGRKVVVIVTLHEQGSVALGQGDIAGAARYFTESLTMDQDLANSRSIVPSLVGLAALACIIQEYVPAVRLLGSVAALVLTSHQVMELMEQKVYDQSLTEGRARLGETTFDSAWAAGQTLPLSEAIAEGLSVAALARSRVPDNSLSSYPAGLTPREVEVLRLVAQGLTNAQIAITLSISAGTVNAHMTSLYRKLNTSSRAVATRFAVEHGLA